MRNEESAPSVMATAKILAALVILSVAATAPPKECRHPVVCPCGRTGRNATFCTESETRYDDVCSRWSECRSCRDGLGVCLECLEGSGGVHCSTALAENSMSCFNPGPIIGGSVHPVFPDSGTVLSEDDPDYPEGTRLEYECDGGFEAEGDRVVTCLSTGIWTSLPPVCTPGGLTTVSEPIQRIQDRTELFCRDPGIVPNGSRKTRHPPDSRGFPVGTAMDYSCNPGHQMVGKALIFCNSSGNWSLEAPRCEPISRNSGGLTTVTEPTQNQTELFCKDPGIDPNGSRKPAHPPDSRGFPFGTVLDHSCKPGHHIIAHEYKLFCTRSGHWSADAPRCEPFAERFPYCPNPGPIPNGRVTFLSSTIYKHLQILTTIERTTEEVQFYPWRSIVEFSCDPGYSLRGQQYSRCETTGKWTYPTPTCKMKDAREMTYCTNPEPVLNGKFILPGVIRSRRSRLDFGKIQWYPEGTRIEYVCSDGHLLEGPWNNTCLPPGEWSSRPPNCTKIRVFCPNPGELYNGEVTLDPTRDGRSSRPPIKNKEGENLEYPRGSRLLYSCDHGFSLRGTDNITCEPTGNWSSPPPVCMTTDPKYRMTCINPGPILNGRVRPVFPDAGTVVSEDDTEYPEGTRLEYECKEGFELEGDPVLTCLSTSLWTSPRPPVCTPDCGRSGVTTGKKIVNGFQVDARKWPWVVAIAVQQNGYSRIVCGGAVLGPQTIITAAHCVTRGGPRFTLYFGKRYRHNDRDDDRVENRTSDEIIIHPDYRNSTMDSDIALITFQPKIDFSALVQPICLPTWESSIKNLKMGSSGYVAGWGLNEKLAVSEELMMASLPVARKSDCLESFRRHVRNFTAPLTRNMFCAGFPDARQATCKGDSGSPMAFFDRVRERFFLEGLVSFGVPAQCGLPGIYTVFTKVFRFLLWIHENVQ